MNQHIAAFVNEHIYGNTLKNGPEAQTALQDLKPGLQRALDLILDRCKKKASDPGRGVSDCRLQWIEVRGLRESRPPHDSMIVEKHVDVFFDKILPILQEYFVAREEKVEDHLMVICAYSAAVSIALFVRVFG